MSNNTDNSMEEKSNLVYFIEDLDTNLWYQNPLLYEDFNTLGEAEWSNDPHKALQFTSRDEAVSFLISALEYRLGGDGSMIMHLVTFSKQYDEIHKRDIARNVAITEHLFI